MIYDNQQQQENGLTIIYTEFTTYQMPCHIPSYIHPNLITYTKKNNNKIYIKRSSYDIGGGMLIKKV